MHDAPAAESLDSLSALAATGDRRAFRKVLDRTHRTVYRVALRVTGSASMADDVVQETFVRVWQRLDTVRDHGAVLGWICRIARNLSYDALRYAGRRKALSLDAPIGEEGSAPLVERIEADEVGPEERLAKLELGGRVLTAMNGLKEKHRLVLQLREIDDMSYEQIASALGCSMGTVESRLHRARKALARKLKGLAREAGLEAEVKP